MKIKLPTLLLLACCATSLFSLVSVAYSAKPGQGGCPSQRQRDDWHQDNLDELNWCLNDGSDVDFCVQEYIDSETQDYQLIQMLCRD